MRLPKATNGGGFPALPMGTPETVSVSGTSASTEAFTADGVVRLYASCGIHYTINGDDTDATTSDTPLAADQHEYRAAVAGDKIHAVQQAGESGGTLYVEYIE